MFIRDFLTGILTDFALFVDAVFESGLVDGISFTSHSTLISGYFIGLDENGVSWNLHPFIHLHNVSHQHIVLVDLHQLSFPYNHYSLSLICHLV